MLEDRLAGESRRHPRAVGLEERFATLLPEVLIGIGLEQFAALAARALEPKPVLEVSLQHIHAADGQRARAGRARRRPAAAQRHDDLPGAVRRLARTRLTTVARFLSLLELFREGAVVLRPGHAAGRADASAGPAREDGEVEITDEFDGAAARGRRRRPRRRARRPPMRSEQ